MDCPQRRDTCVPRPKGFVGGSMGDISVIIEGRDSRRANEMMRSTIHGADA